MPNRVLREGILDSDRMTALVQDANWAGECFYRRLHSIGDDYGCFDARPSVLRAKCFPTLLELVREADVQRWIAACEKSGLIRLYTADGRNYGQILDFKQFTRIKHRKYPIPPWECDADATHVRTDAGASVSDSDSNSPPGNGDARGKGEPPPGFSRFWAEYPGDRKVDKAKCLEKWGKHELEGVIDTILSGLNWWKRHRDWTKEDGKFICAPLVFINKRSWEAAAGFTPVPKPAKPMTDAEKTSAAWACIPMAERVILQDSVRMHFEGNPVALRAVDVMMIGGKPDPFVVAVFIELKKQRDFDVKTGI